MIDSPSSRFEGRIAVMTFFGVLIAVFLLSLLWARFAVPSLPVFQISETSDLSNTQPGDEITVMTWNLGYANLGAASDFVADGGKSFRGASRAAAQSNMDQEAAFIGGADYDVFFLQELARASWGTHGIDSVDRIGALNSGWFGFAPDVTSRLLVPPFRPTHGPGFLSRFRPTSATISDLPLDEVRIAGMIRRNYHAQVLRFANAAGEPGWTLINIHLAAFDEGANARREQLETVFELARAEAATGADVIIGGDWNLRLTDSDFPHTTLEEHLFWVHDFPREMLPEGWQIVIDPSTPTVRTLERSYTRGENYTTIIDGFIVSPGVELIEVATSDLDFQPGDHQPIRARFRHRAARSD